jgi:predicted transcriptional regulator
MERTELGEVQERFARIVWAHAPIPSGELVKLCEKELHWKKPTTYTVLRKLCERGLFENVNGVVEIRVPQETFYAAKSERFVDNAFNGSLPAFLTAFTARKGLTDADADEIMRMIEARRRENKK